MLILQSKEGSLPGWKVSSPAHKPVPVTSKRRDPISQAERYSYQPQILRPYQPQILCPPLPSASSDLRLAGGKKVIKVRGQCSQAVGTRLPSSVPALCAASPVTGAPWGFQAG